jgi:hypothetical protein
MISEVAIPLELGWLNSSAFIAFSFQVSELAVQAFVTHMDGCLQRYYGIGTTLEFYAILIVIEFIAGACSSR